MPGIREKPIDQSEAPFGGNKISFDFCPLGERLGRRNLVGDASRFLEKIQAGRGGRGVRKQGKRGTKLARKTRREKKRAHSSAAEKGAD